MHLIKDYFILFMLSNTVTARRNSFCALFNNAVSTQTALHQMEGCLMKWKELGSRCALNKVLPWQLSGETDESHENLSQDSQCPG